MRKLVTHFVSPALVLATQLTPAFTQAQPLAAVQLASHTPLLGQQEPASAASRRDLLEVLDELSVRFNVHFLYERRNLIKKLVATNVLEEGQIEKILDQLLPLVNLHYEKVQPRTFAIVPGRVISPSSRTIPLLAGTSPLLASTAPGTPLPHWVLAETPISGKVTDEKGEGLPGVTVLLKGSTTGITTGQDGSFRLVAPGSGGTLVFSFVGYESQEIALGTRTTVEVSLKPSAKALGDVVVVGYGTQRREDLTGSVASITSKDIQELPVTSLEQAMQGRMAGVQVQQSSGQPGAGISIRIRGVGSIAGGTEPLFVIDGVPQFNSDVSSTNGLAALNPADIESIEVLKDAASTAIYGSRGANGVVMVTTKKGKAGQMRVNYSAYATQQSPRKRLDLMSGEEYIGFVRELYANSNRTVPTELTNVPNANTDWQDLVLRKAWQQDHSLSFSGGSERVQYYSSVDYLAQNGIVRGTDYSRGSIRLNLNANLSSRVSLQTNVVASRGIQNGSTPSDNSSVLRAGKSGIGAVLLAAPTATARNPDGTYANVRLYPFSGLDTENPLAIVNEALDRRTITRVQGDIDLKINILKNLTNTTRLGVITQDRRGDVYLPKILTQATSGLGAGQLNLNNTFNVLAENFAEYKADLGSQLKFGGVVGVSYQSQRVETVALSASGYLSDELKDYNFAAANSVSKPVTDIIINNIASAFSRVSLNFRDRYLLSASVRGDGASVFSKNNKYGVFPSLGLGWKLNEEAFIKQALPSLNNAKLRASWGQTGNPAIQPYQSLSLGNVLNTGQGAGTGLAVGLAPTLPNNNLSWETTTQTDVGLDLGFANDRFRATLDFYNRNTRSLLATVQLPASSGYSTIIDNVGEVQNKGVELALGATVINTGDFTWSIDVNGAVNRNKVLKTSGDRDLLSSYGSIIRVGEPINSFYTLRFNGFSDQGKQTWVDQNGDGIIDGKDFVVVGSAFPSFTYGVLTNVTYKRFSLAATFQGVQGVRVNNQFLYELTSPSAEYNHIRNIRDYYPNPSVTDVRNSSDLYIEDASFVRLKNIRIDYRLPLAGTGFLKSLNFYGSAQNLFTITKYSGYDPEVNSFGSTSTLQGVDYAAYPSFRAFTVGLNAGF